jgi:hypothetical protein
MDTANTLRHRQRTSKQTRTMTAAEIEELRLNLVPLAMQGSIPTCHGVFDWFGFKARGVDMSDFELHIRYIGVYMVPVTLSGSVKYICRCQSIDACSMQVLVVQLSGQSQVTCNASLYGVCMGLTYGSHVCRRSMLCICGQVLLACFNLVECV